VDSLSGRKPPQRRLLSLQETLELMLLCGVSMERYIIYSSLSRIGYLLMRCAASLTSMQAASPA
jgi:hypothetical protein